MSTEKKFLGRVLRFPSFSVLTGKMPQVFIKKNKSRDAKIIQSCKTSKFQHSNTLDPLFRRVHSHHAHSNTLHSLFRRVHSHHFFKRYFSKRYLYRESQIRFRRSANALSHLSSLSTDTLHALHPFTASLDRFHTSFFYATNRNLDAKCLKV